MKYILILLTLFYVNCSPSTNFDSRLRNVPKFTAEEFSLTKFSECFGNQSDSIFSKNALTWKIGIITLSNITKDTIWVLTEKKYGNLFYGPSYVKVYENNSLVGESIANRFADTKTKILPNSSQCFLTFFINPIHGSSQEMQLDYLRDTTNMILFHEWVKINGFKNKYIKD